MLSSAHGQFHPKWLMCYLLSANQGDSLHRMTRKWMVWDACSEFARNCSEFARNLLGTRSSLGICSEFARKTAWTSHARNSPHKHKSFELVTLLVRGKSPGRVARGQRFMCYPWNPRNINLFARLPDQEDR